MVFHGLQWNLCLCLFKVKDCFSPLLSESQQLLVPLEELEKQMTAFYDSLGKIDEIMTVLEPEAQSSPLFKQKHQMKFFFQETWLIECIGSNTEVHIMIEIQW